VWSHTQNPADHLKGLCHVDKLSASEDLPSVVF
jgi:hypothetical protein